MRIDLFVSVAAFHPARLFFSLLSCFPPTQSLVSPVVGVSAFLVRYVGLCCVSFWFPLRVISCGLFPPSPRAPHYRVCFAIRSVSDVFLVVFGCVICVLSCWSWNLIAMCSVLCGFGLC